MKTINIGLVGFGTVGVGVVRLFQKQAVLLERRVGARLRVKRIADIDLKRVRDVEVDPSILTTDARDVTGDNAIDIVIELIGGTTVARDVGLAALRKKQQIIPSSSNTKIKYSNHPSVCLN